MKLTCNRARLNHGLQTIVGVVDPRHIKPILQQIKVVATKEEIILSATDLEIGMRCVIEEATIEEPGEIVLPGARLANIVRELGDEVVRIASDETNCTLQGSGSRFRIRGDRTDEFPEIPSFPEGKYIEVEASVLREMIHKTVFAAAPEKMRYALNGVLFVSHEDKKLLEMVGTDGRRMAWVKRQANAESPVSTEVIVPTKGCLQVERMLPESGPVKLWLGERNFFAKTAHAELVAQLVDGQYPNYRAVVPEKLEKKANLPTAALMSAVRKAALLSDADNRTVMFEFKEGQLVLSAAAPEAGESTVEIEAEFSDEPVCISLNPDFVIDGLKAMDEASVHLEMKDSATACVLREPDFVYLTMPITE